MREAGSRPVMRGGFDSKNSTEHFLRKRAKETRVKIDKEIGKSGVVVLRLVYYI